MLKIYWSQELSSYELGASGETVIGEWFRRLGFSVTYPEQGTDLILEGFVRIEVKTARQGRDGKWRFTLNRCHNGVVRQDTKCSDFVVANCVENDGTINSFVIPATLVNNQSRLVISSSPQTYKGSYKGYLNRFDLITKVATW